MSTDSSAGHHGTSTATIFLIRHGEKPPLTPPPNGVTSSGDVDPHSLSTIGWQRAGALMTLFAPLDSQFRVGFMNPMRVVVPQYTDPITPADNERTHQTIHPIRTQLGLSVETPCKVGEEKTSGLGHHLAGKTGVTLVCWEHHGLQLIAEGIAPHAEIPPWDGKRFDMVWVFTSDTGPSGFKFKQIPQLLLPADSPHPIEKQKDALQPSSP
jgi:hypothetical protein